MKGEIENEMTAIQISKNDAQIEEFDFETAIRYCTQFIADLPRQWQDMGVEQKARLQIILFPKGIFYNKDGNNWYTAELSPIFATKKTDYSSQSVLVAGVRVARTIFWLCILLRFSSSPSNKSSVFVVWTIPLPALSRDGICHLVSTPFSALGGGLARDCLFNNEEGFPEFGR